MIIRRSARLIGAIFAAMVLLAACGSSATQDVAAESGADAASSSALAGEFTTISGEQIDFGSLEGEDVVLWFWAPW